MSVRIFPTPQDAENAFYESLERGDFELMMAVWGEDEDIVCVHPAGPRIAGQEQVRESWRRIFASGQRLRVQIAQQVTVSGMMVAVHSVHEVITVAGESQPRPPVIATNVYLRTAAGWRMIVHHASPAPGPATEPPEDPPKILH
ncbi:MAG: nuclear transport factor 2 family protein [Betaproteobacteria bacterium]|nr:nuclear transport factor 2 family protein [Betaproteobacteria bacterium]